MHCFRRRAGISNKDVSTSRHPVLSVGNLGLEFAIQKIAYTRHIRSTEIKI